MPRCRCRRPVALLDPLEPRHLLSTVPTLIGGMPSAGNSAPTIVSGGTATGPLLVLQSPVTGLVPGVMTQPGSVTTFTTLTATVTNNLTVAIVARVQSANANSLPEGSVTFSTTGGQLLATLPVSRAMTSTSSPALGQVSVALPLSLLSSGTHVIIAHYSGDVLHAASTSNSISVTNVARTIAAIGSPVGAASHVTVFDTATGRVLRSFDPFPGFTGGVHVAVGDINGDGIPDVVAAPGQGGLPLVRVFNLVSGSSFRDFFAFPTAFHGGVNLAIGDVNGDGAEDIVAAEGPGGSPLVRVFSGRNGLMIQDFAAFDTAFKGGVNVAAGDVTGDGLADIIAAPETSGGPQVKVFDGLTGLLVNTFFGARSSFRGGLSVGITDINHDGIGEIVTATGAGVVPQVEVFADNNAPMGAFVPASQFFTAGLNISTFDYNGDGVADIVVGSPSGGLRPLVFDGLTRKEISPFLPSVGFANGSFIGGFVD
ncbi:MAG TPA: FG-GAP-like repeat-containing protein [Phycisphaerae bacterium]|nr:FG-GAP-like repeat-containing protein [Phycisphaerae bacterium]